MNLLAVAIPAIAAFLAAREWANRHGSRSMWMVLAPVIGLACALNRNRFVGILEMAFPLALMWALTAWRSASDYRQSLLASARVSALLGVAACILLSLMASLPQVGLLAMLSAGVTLIAAWVLRNGPGLRSRG